jgi:hypothetical protein
MTKAAGNSEELAREWRFEFPCQIIHQNYPEGTTCLDCRDLAIANKPPPSILRIVPGAIYLLGSETLL